MIFFRTFDIVERTVQMMCSYLPESIAEQCESFVDKYGDQLIKILVEEELDPKEFCTEMGACQEVTQRLFGEDRIPIRVRPFPNFNNFQNKSFFSHINSRTLRRLLLSMT